MRNDIAAIRKDYKLESLLETDANSNPFEQFGHWWQQAVESEVDEVNAMYVSTVDEDGYPHGRIVLLKSFDEHGFVFFTNYQSNKGNQIATNPKASITFFWKELERQVRLVGTLEKISEQESDIYFNSRPIGSQIGAWSSPQSKAIPNREILTANEAFYTAKFGNQVPRPPHWGGYRLAPKSFEFWQGRSNRLHDRLYYTPQEAGWKVTRLAP